MARRTAAEAEQTRVAVLAAGRRLFATRGYNGVSVPECADAAGVTHGGLYHHYPSKAALFEAVFAQLTGELDAHVMHEATKGTSIRDAFLRGCRASIDFMAGAEYQQVALTDAPTVLGWQRWRAIDSEIGFPTMVGGLAALQADGQLAKAADLTALAVVLFGGLTEAAIRTAKDDGTTSADAVIATIDALLDALS